ncbi:MAG TPA: hypothetical protein VGO81_04640 [Solirubrobacteraceae bacterium]|nr:hypothetical protein [Solirubrobacteraceae bacterium]
MRCDINLRDGALTYRGSVPDDDPAATAVIARPAEFELARVGPGAAPLYYRLGRGRLELSDELGALLPDGPPPAPDHGVLLAMIHGLPDAPGSTVVPGVQQLTVGDVLRADRDGVSVLRRPPQLAATATDLQRAIAAAIPHDDDGEVAVAHSGGLASSFVAVAAGAAGRRPELFHADLDGGSAPLPEIAGTHTYRVACDVSDILDPDQITGRELCPPLPETVLRRRMLARLQEASGMAVVSGALLESLVSTTLPEVGAGRWGRRLLTCEPFHREGTLATVREAREVLADKGVGALGRRESESQQPGAAPREPSQEGGLPGLTDAGREALKSARLATGAVWRTHLDDLPAALGRVEAASHEAGLAPGVVVPALDSRVLGAIAALGPRELGRIHRGRFVNQAPLRDALARARVGQVREASSGFRVRLAAAAYVHRERRRIAGELARDCALADLGLLDPAPVLRLLQDPQATADRALTILRLSWLDRWLRRR